MPPRDDAGESATPGHTEVPGCRRLDPGWIRAAGHRRGPSCTARSGHDHDLLFRERV